MHIYKENEGKKIAFIFSCPGKTEKEQKRPCAGKTGDNLQKLISILNKKESLFPEKRRDYHINNAWDKVEYKKCTLRTEATIKELKRIENINRLREELSKSEIIVCFGRKAIVAITELKKIYNIEKKVISTRHLGLQSLNQIRRDVNNTILTRGKENNTYRRLEVVANEILEQL